MLGIGPHARPAAVARRRRPWQLRPDFAGARFAQDPFADIGQEKMHAFFIFVKAKGYPRKWQAPAIAPARIEIDAIVASRQCLRGHVNIESPRVIAHEIFLVCFAPTPHIRRHDIHARYRRPIAAASHGTAADETQTGVIKIVAVEVIDSYGRRSRTDETINDKIVEKPVDAHVAVAEEAFAN